MERLLLKAILERILLFFVPIALGYVWGAVSSARAARRASTGPGAAAERSTPTALRRLLWLAAAGAALVGVSLIGGVFLPHAPDRGVYVPGEAGPGGAVRPGRFIPARKNEHD